LNENRESSEISRRKHPGVASSGLVTAFQDRVIREPVIAFFLVAGVLGLAESVSVHALFDWWPVLKQFEPLIETALSLIIALPLFLFLFVLPSARNLRRREAAERALRAQQEVLEARVRERTAELEESSSRLMRESEDRRRAQHSVELQARLLDAVEQSVMATDREGRILYWNRFAEGLYGWKTSEAKGRVLRDLVGFTQSDGQPLDLMDPACGDGSWTGEVEAVGRDGLRFPAYLSCSRIGGEADGRLLLSFDLTKLKRAEEALRESEAKYSNLVERAPTGVFLYQDDKLLFVNPSFAELLDYPRSELLDREPWRLVHPKDRDWVAEIARKRAAGEEVPEEYRCRLITRSGEVRWVEMRNTRIRHQGRAATLGNVQDVTDRRRMEEQLHQLSARLLTIQEDERRRVARDLHDSLGQRLTGVKFLIEASLGAPWPEERRRSWGQMRTLIPMIQEAVEEVRRISTDLRPSILDDLGLLPTIAWHLREFEKLHPGIAVEQQVGVEESEVPDTLRTPIFRVLQEASNNVAKHSGGARMVVGLETEKGRLRLWIGDDGVGLDPEVQGRGQGDGGIGLGSMRERVELSGGSFSVSSAPGGGTTVWADWPLEPAVSA